MSLNVSLEKARSYLGKYTAADDGASDAGLVPKVRSALFIGLLVWLLVITAYRGALNTGDLITGIDFEIFYDTAARWNHGLPLYQPHGQLYAYSPLLALILRPLAMIPLGAALKFWFCFSAACLVLSVLVYGSAARMKWSDAASLGIMLVTGFRFWPTTMNFALGQLNFLMLLLLCSMFWADNRRKTVMLGILIGFAALFKIWMLGLLLYPLLKRQWSAVTAAIGLCVLAFPLLFTLAGWREFPAFLQASISTSQQVSRISITHSLFGFMHLHFQSNALLDPFSTNRLLYAAFLLAGLAGVGYGYLLLWRNRDFSSYYQRLSLGLVAVSVLLLLPPCQNEYLVLCLPLLWTMIAPVETGATDIQIPMMLAGWVIYLLFSRGWGPYAPVPAAYHHGWRSILVSTGFLAMSALWLAGILFLRRQRNYPALAEE